MTQPSGYPITLGSDAFPIHGPFSATIWRDGDSSSALGGGFSTHNPTHRMRCLVRLARCLAVPACLQVVVRPHHAALSRHFRVVSDTAGKRRERKGTVRHKRSNICGGVVQLVRTPACHAGGRGFVPSLPPFFPGYLRVLALDGEPALLAHGLADLG